MGHSFFCFAPCGPLDPAIFGCFGFPRLGQRALAGVMNIRPGESRPSPGCALMGRSGAAVKPVPGWLGGSDVRALDCQPGRAAKIMRDLTEHVIEGTEKGCVQALALGAFHEVHVALQFGLGQGGVGKA